MGSIITLSIVQSALELGFIYALVALALFISFSILNIADLSTDGCFTLGCAVCASVTLAGHPVLGLLAAMAAGVCSGFVTAFLQTRLGIQSILAGIIVNTGLYTINIAVMGFASNLNLFACDSVFTWAKDAIGGTWYKLIVAAVIVALISLFLNTRLGLSIRATGDNPDMVRASSINTGMMITIGLCVANALTGLSGGLLAQYQKSCDINLGTGMVTIALASLIIGETIIPIKNTLSGLPGTDISEIERVYSKAEALMQASHFLGEHGDWQQISVANTALAAKKILEDQDKHQAAVCSAYAASVYGLSVLADSINDEKNNSTRFIVITNQKVFLKDAKKISICLELPHESSSLYHLLSHFAYNDLNMTKIESRPMEGKSWEYRFFIDFEGNLADPAVKNAIRGLREEGRNLRILGNY